MHIPLEIQTACSGSVNHSVPFPCVFPPCSCEKCQQRRADADPDSEELLEYCTNPSQDNVTHTLVATEGSFGAVFSKFGFNIHPSSIYSVLFDVIGTIAFIIMTTFTFWLMVGYYMWKYTVKLYHCQRKVQILAVVLLSLLILCIVIHARSDYKVKSHQNDEPSKGSDSSKTLNNCESESCLNTPKECDTKLCKKDRCSAQKSTSSRGPISSTGSEIEMNSVLIAEKQRCRERGGADAPNSLTGCGKSRRKFSFCANSANKDSPPPRPRERGGAEAVNLCKGCGKLRKRYSFLNIKNNSEGDSKKMASDSLCNLCAKMYKKSCSERTSTIDEYETRRMFQKFKLYSLPMEWKSPPAIIVLLMDYLTNLFGGPSRTSSAAQIS